MTPDTFLEWAKRFPEALMLVSEKGSILACNPAMAEIAGVTSSALRERSLQDLATPSPEKGKESLRLWAGSGRMLFGPAGLQIGSVSLRCEGALLRRRQGNNPALLLVRARPHQSTSERFQLLTQKVDELSREIRARKQSEDEAIRQREWLQVTLSSIGDAVIATNASGKVIFMNAVAEALTGWNMEEAAGLPMTTVFSIFNEETGTVAQNPVERVLREGITVGLANHTVLRSKQGVERPIEDSAAPIRGPQGNLIGVVLVFHDVSDRRENEFALKRSRDEAIAASRAKDEFLAALSHELRTPLNPVLLLASEAASHPDLPEKVRRDFELIAKNIALEARLIDDLLDLTRITEGELTLVPGPVDLHAVLRDAVETVRPALEKLDQHLEVDLGAEPSLVNGDAVRLQQAFWNLLENAVKFSPPGAAIVLRSRYSAPDETLVVTLTDSGIGMSPAELSRVFEPFVYGDHARRGGIYRGGGLGLGLSLARRVIELHAGTIEASSEGAGRGTTFTVRLPAAVPACEQPRPVSPPARLPSSPGLQVLLVEDHPPTLAVLSHLLISRGFQVVSASSMREGLAAAECGPFDLLVSDIGLPDGDGYELMSRLRERSAIPGIAISGFGKDEDIAKSRAAGFFDHLIKPISIQTLEQALDALPLIREDR